MFLMNSKGSPFQSCENITGKCWPVFVPERMAFIEQSIESPYEIHLGEFESEEDFEAFLQDEERKQFLHMKDQAIRSTILVKGKRN